MAALQLLQTRFGVVDLQGKIMIVDLDQLQNTRLGTPHCETHFYERTEAEVLMRRQVEAAGLGPWINTLMKDFLSNQGTRLFNQIAFTPMLLGPNILNLWIGPTVRGIPGRFDLIDEFLREVICDGNLTDHNYLISFLAHAIQKPEEKPGVMPVLIGNQGTGKGTLLRLLSIIWGKTSLQVSDVDKVIGRFNAALERNFMILMDEALFKGDHKALERLKSMITEPVIGIEQKMQPSRTIASVHRFIAVTNHEKFARVDRDDRRFIVFRVSDCRQGDNDYFTKLHTEIETGNAVSAFVHYLEQLDLIGFNVRIRPKTAEHANQKIQSLEGFDRFWFEVLYSGSLHGSRQIDGDYEWVSPQFISSSDLLEHYKTFNKNSERYAPMQSRELKSRLELLCRSVCPARGASFLNNMVRGYKLPSLSRARAEFETFLGGSVPGGWPD